MMYLSIRLEEEKHSRKCEVGVVEKLRREAVVDVAIEKTGVGFNTATVKVGGDISKRFW